MFSPQRAHNQCNAVLGLQSKQLHEKQAMNVQSNSKGWSSCQKERLLVVTYEDFQRMQTSKLVNYYIFETNSFIDVIDTDYPIWIYILSWNWMTLLWSC